MSDMIYDDDDYDDDEDDVPYFAPLRVSFCL